MSIALTTIGVKISVAFESVAGVRPTTGFKIIPKATSFPAMNAEPEQLETTSFENLISKTYTPGLKDFGGAFPITAVASNELDEFWEGDGGIMDEWEAKKAAGLGMWVCVDVPNRARARYIPVVPDHLGDSELGVNSVVESNLPLTLTGDPVWDVKPTYEGTTTYNVTVTGYVVSGVDIDVLKGDTFVSRFTTGSDVSTIIKLPAGSYTFMGRKAGVDTQVIDSTISADTTVTFDSFTE